MRPMNTEPGDEPGPYAEAAAVYFDAGWTEPLPLPAREKHDPPRGFTGRNLGPSRADVQAWIDGDEGRGNIAIRLPEHIVGIDVDHYGTKVGGNTTDAFRAAHGDLPTTWRSTSRDDGTSGIYFYRVPPGLKWPGQLGPDVEIIQHGHRYAVVWPSIHPTGSLYRWYTPEGVASTVPPDPDLLPLLPAGWVTALTGGQEAGDPIAKADLAPGAALTWLTTNCAPGTACRRTGYALATALADLAAPGSVHESARGAVLRLVGLAGEHHAGVSDAITRLGRAFVEVVTSPRERVRTAEEAHSEWFGLVMGAVQIAAAKPGNPRIVDPCDNPFAGIMAPDRTRLLQAPQVAWDSVTYIAGAAPAPAGVLTNVTPLEPVPEPERSTWAPIDLDAAWDGDEDEGEVPSILSRADGAALLYRGQLNGLIGEAESGKAQPLTAPVATPYGWRTIGDLMVGDEIIGVDGQRQTVQAVYDRGLRRVWEVETSDGVLIEACDEHLWAVQTSNDRFRGGGRVLTTAALAAKPGRYYLPLTEPVQYEPKILRVDPYALGLLLGDGHLGREVTFTKGDDVLHRALLTLLPDAVGRHQGDLTTALTNVPDLLAALDDWGLRGKLSAEKFVPDEYLTAPIADRHALLQGLLDSDGSAEPGTITYYTSSPQLADDVAELVRSLGGTAKVSWRTPHYTHRGERRTGQQAARVTIRLPHHLAPFRLPRKADAYRPEQPPVRAIRSVAATGRWVPMRCIAVSNPDHLYLTTGYTVTHNTWLAYEAMRQVLDDGGLVQLYDFEDSRSGAISRLKALSVAREQVRERLRYINPDEPVLGGASPQAWTDLAANLDEKPDLIIVDGYNAAMGSQGLDMDKNGDVTAFASLLRKMAACGAAVVTIDHVPKNPDGRLKGGIGAQAKRASVTGVTIRVEIDGDAYPAPGKVGYLRLSVDKDRRGRVREAAVGNHLAMVMINSDAVTRKVSIKLSPPDPGAAPVVSTDKRPGTFDADLAAALCAAVAAKGAPVGLNEFRGPTLLNRGRNPDKVVCRDWLIKHDYLVREPGSTGYVVAKMYDATDQIRLPDHAPMLPLSEFDYDDDGRDE